MPSHLSRAVPPGAIPRLSGGYTPAQTILFSCLPDEPFAT